MYMFYNIFCLVWTERKPPSVGIAAFASPGLALASLRFGGYLISTARAYRKSWSGRRVVSILTSSTSSVPRTRISLTTACASGCKSSVSPGIRSSMASGRRERSSRATTERSLSRLTTFL